MTLFPMEVLRPGAAIRIFRHDEKKRRGWPARIVCDYYRGWAMRTEPGQTFGAQLLGGVEEAVETTPADLRVREDE